MIALIVIGGIAVIAIVIYIIWYYNRQRTKALKLIAESLNFTFAEKCDNSLLNALGTFHLFSQGHSRRIFERFYWKVQPYPRNRHGLQIYYRWR